MGQAQAPAGKLLHGLDPVGVQDLKLSDDLLAYLVDSDGCRTAEDSLQELGFERCVDYPDLPGRIYYEGYFHTLPTSGPMHSVHPRHGVDFAKPAAPVQLRAFAESFRQKNLRTIQSMAAAMPWGSVLRTVLKEGRAFADLAMQVHFGDAVGSDHVAWHVDASNSALHMAVSLLGCRTLKMKVASEEENANREVQDKPQCPGDVYVGNPVSYVHGLEYPSAAWDQRVVACQFRLLMTQAEMYDPFASAGLRAIADFVARRPLAIPSLMDVQKLVAEWES